MKVMSVLLILGLLSSTNLYSEDQTGIGMINTQTGATAALGIGMKKGATAYLKKINYTLPNGFKFDLMVSDDGYEPTRTIALTERTVANPKTLALFGFVGTPTTVSVIPILDKNNISMIAPFTGAEALRNPVNKNIYNVRASYFDETEVLVERLIQDKKAKKIALFIQDDGYGAAGEAGVVKALKARGMEVAAKGTYVRNTVDIDQGFTAVSKAAPDAVVLIGSYRACAAFIKKAKQSGMNVPMANVSFVGTAALIKELGADAEGVIISQVMPSPFDSSNPLVKEYQADMAASGATDFDYTSIEGYIGAKVLAEALKNAKAPITRDSLRASLDSLSLDFSGFKVNFSSSNHSGSKKVYLTVVKSGMPKEVKSL